MNSHSDHTTDEESDRDSDTNGQKAKKYKRSLSGRHIIMTEPGAPAAASSAQEEISTIGSDTSKDIAALSSKVNILSRQMLETNQKNAALKSIVVKMSKSMETMYNGYTDLQKRSMGNNIQISNIKEREYNRHGLIQICRQSLIDIGVHPDKVDIERAHRTGPYTNDRPRLVIARMNRQDDVEHILEVTKPPRDARYDPRAIRVTPQIPNTPEQGLRPSWYCKPSRARFRSIRQRGQSLQLRPRTR